MANRGDDQITEILVDMDNVTVDMIGFLKKIWPEYEDYKDERIFRVIEALLPYDFYVHLKPVFDFDIGIKYLRYLEKRGYKIIICSSMTNNPYRSEIKNQKILWNNDHCIGDWTAIYTAGSNRKQDHAAPHRLLIDDYVGAGRPFQEAGGHWVHHTNWYTTIQLTNKILFGKEKL